MTTDGRPAGRRGRPPDPQGQWRRAGDNDALVPPTSAPGCSPAARADQGELRVGVGVGAGASSECGGMAAGSLVDGGERGWGRGIEANSGGGSRLRSERPSLKCACVHDGLTGH